MNNVKLKDIFRFKNGEYYQVTEINHLLKTIRLYRIVPSDFNKALAVVNGVLNNRSVQGANTIRLDDIFGNLSANNALETLHDLKEFIWMDVTSLRLNVHCRTQCAKGFIFDVEDESLRDLTIPGNIWQDEP